MILCGIEKSYRIILPLVLVAVIIFRTAASEGTCSEVIQDCPGSDRCFGRKMFDASVEYACSQPDRVSCTGHDGCLSTCAPPHVPCVVARASTTSSTGLPFTFFTDPGLKFSESRGDKDGDEDDTEPVEVEPESSSCTMAVSVAMCLALLFKTL